MSEDLTAIEDGRLKEILEELRRISALEKDLKKQKEEFTAEVVPILDRIGSRVIIDPITQQMRSAHVIRAERLTVDAAELYEALLEQENGDVEQADMVWKSVLKDPEVDTKDDGKFVTAASVNADGHRLITPETAAKVARYKRSAAYVAYVRPGV